MLRTPSRAWGLVLAFWVALAAAQEAQTSSYFRATGSNGGFEIGAAGSVQVRRFCFWPKRWFRSSLRTLLNFGMRLNLSGDDEHGENHSG